MYCKFVRCNLVFVCRVCSVAVEDVGQKKTVRECSGQSPTYILDSLPTGNKLWACHNCDWTAELPEGEAPMHVCGQKDAPRLGDRIESALESLGVTKERWLAVKEYVGATSTCDCTARKEWLNRLDEKLELGEKLTAFKAFFGWKDN